MRRRFFGHCKLLWSRKYTASSYFFSRFDHASWLPFKVFGKIRSGIESWPTVYKTSILTLGHGCIKSNIYGCDQVSLCQNPFRSMSGVKETGSRSLAFISNWVAWKPTCNTTRKREMPTSAMNVPAQDDLHFADCSGDSFSWGLQAATKRNISFTTNNLFSTTFRHLLPYNQMKSPWAMLINQFPRTFSLRK